jgi:uncharacterized protein YyaL (SSP411 family)
MNRGRTLTCALLSLTASSLSLASSPPTLLAAAASASLRSIDPPSEKPADEKPAVYDEAADARKDIAQALKVAKRENRRVLIQWGGNWCHWCLLLHKLCDENQDISKTLLYEYEVVLVDAGRDGKNLDLAAEYKADCKKQGFPYLTILDANGKPLANQETGSLELKEKNGESVLGQGMGHDPAKVLKFLKDHQAAPADANAVLKAALAEAKKNDKRVFLHFGAPWCGWCHRLEDWMHRNDISKLLAKDFVDVKVDVDRMTNGNDVLAKYNSAGQKTGIPWFVFLDAEGKPVADCMREENGKKENIGFPAAPAEVAHFESMLRKGAKKLSSAEIAKIVESLKEKPAGR